MSADGDALRRALRGEAEPTPEPQDAVQMDKPKPWQSADAGAGQGRDQASRASAADNLNEALRMAWSNKYP